MACKKPATALKPEGCTKDELIWYIHYRCFYNAKNFESDILFHRLDENQKAASDVSEKEMNALNRYSDLMRPYEEKPIFAVPKDILDKADAEMKKREAALTRYKTLERQYKALNNRIEKLLDDKETENDR